MSDGAGTRQSDVPALAPFHVLAKPTGAICNLDCAYCFYLEKEDLYPDGRFRMDDSVLEAYIGQLLASQAGPEATVAWQGGEPAIMGVDFYRRAVQIAEELRAPGQRVVYTIQTNGTLLSDELCEVFAEHDFLVGISIDGPREMHDAHRVDKRGQPTYDRVIEGLERLAAHRVEFNVLCTVNSANEDHPLEVYRHLRDDLGAEFIQFIPVVEHDTATGEGTGQRVSGRSVAPDAWGRFLIDVFDTWVTRDVGRVFVNHFDAALASWLGLPPGMCIFAETCGDALALEHNGDLYSCDHFVDGRHRLGNITETSLPELVGSDAQRAFGNAKRDTLPSYCRECEVFFACHGECPKNRFTTTPAGDPGLNYLCAGYKAFFGHVDGPMRLMADLLRQGRHADEVMKIFATAGRNEPCPCGSGRKAKLCHGR